MVLVIDLRVGGCDRMGGEGRGGGGGFFHGIFPFIRECGWCYLFGTSGGGEGGGSGPENEWVLGREVGKNEWIAQTRDLLSHCKMVWVICLKILFP